jgi:hypothetical protein
MSTRLAENAAPFSTAQDAEWVCGPCRRPTNNSRHEAGSIHDDATARELGFRGGTIAGSIHMEQFEPLCVAMWGDEWLARGELSLNFRNASLHGEPVQAMLSRDEIVLPTLRRRRARMLNANGTVVLEGSASFGAHDENAAVTVKLKEAAARTGVPRILASVPVGFAREGLATSVPQKDIDARLPIITEVSPWFSDPSKYGYTLAPLSASIHAMRVFEGALPMQTKDYVGMFGAIEWQYLRGPVFSDYPYLIDGRVVAISDSPKTELLWYECVMRDAARGHAVARMLMQSRLLKSSSPLWAA